MKTEGAQRKIALVLWCVLNFPVLLATAWIISTQSFALGTDLGGLSFVLLGWLGFRAAEDMPDYSVLRGAFLEALLGFVTSLIWAVVVIEAIEHTVGSRRADFAYLLAPAVNALLFPLSYLIHRRYLAADAVLRRRLLNEVNLKRKEATAEAHRTGTGIRGALARNRWLIGGALLLVAVGCLVVVADIRDAISYTQPSPAKKWELNTGKFRRSHYLVPFSQRTPAINEQGMIFASGSAGVFAVTPDGGVKWFYPQSSCTSPVLADDDSVWVDGCSDDNRFGGIMRINPDGSPSKQGMGGLGTVTQIGLAYEGTVYMGTAREGMVAISSAPSVTSSSVKWRHPGRGFVLDENNKVYANSGAGLVRYSSDGVAEWNSPADDCAPPALGSDGSIYNVCNGLEVINPNGTLKWTYRVPDATVSPVIAEDGTVYFGDDHGVLHAIGADGQPKWTFTAPGFHRKFSSIRLIPSYVTAYLVQMFSPQKLPPHYSVADERPNEQNIEIRSTPAIARNGTIYFGSADHNLYAVGADGKLKWIFETGGEVYSPTIAPDGTIYVQSEDGKLYALTESETNGGLWGQWPKLGSGLRNTARGSR